MDFAVSCPRATVAGGWGLGLYIGWLAYHGNLYRQIKMALILVTVAKILKYLGNMNA